jgi:hypothetical protein
VSIDMPAEEVRALGRSLAARADTADEVRARLTDDGGIDGPLRPAVARFLDCHVVLATALAGELAWLGSTVTGIADSWLELDAALVPGQGAGPGR